MTKSVTRLFQQFQPAQYGLALDVDRDAMTFQGTVMIRGKKIGRPSQRLTFHQKDLTIIKATITKHDKKGDQIIKVSRINSQKSFDEVRLHTEVMLYPGEYSVTMDFKGIITKPMDGIYPCFFKHNDQDKILIASQFESHYARQAFPCIDEPEAKATFDLTLITPVNETVIANTPVKGQTTNGDRQVTSFETTPRMSCYLLAFVFGELGFKEAKTKDGVVVRAYATPDNVAQTGHGLQVAVRALEFFGDYFGTPYPLPKLDMVALPDFSNGAMENWGLVTYRETTMLADPKSSSIETKQYVALVICHELSHQWFGNLVTMKWWDDLWLNESFANMMEYRAVDELYPEWHIWEHFVSGESASAKRRDSLLDVQPIHVNVTHPDQITTIFDPSIVYAKGGTVLHMLMHYIGEEAFRAGLKQYFLKHQYANTTASDLWDALSAASHHDIAQFMSGWINRPGYPLVTVNWRPGSQTVELTQQRFLSDAALRLSESDNAMWQVPLAATRQLSQPLLEDPSTISKITDKVAGPLLFNHNGQSYYLPHYANPDHVSAIVEAIRQAEVAVIDRLLLIDSYIMLQRSGNTATTTLLDLLPAYEYEDSESVWGNIAIAIGEVRKLMEGDEASEAALNKLIERIVMPTVERLGWQDSPDDSAQTLRLRGLALSLAAGAKVSSVLKEARSRFNKFSTPSDLPATVRSVVYFVGARHGDAAMFQKLLALHNDCHNADEREELASALTAAKEPAQYKQLLSLLKSEAIRRQDLLHWFVWLLRNRYSRAASWEWLTKSWDWIETELASDKSFSYFARYCGMVFSTVDELEQFKLFFESKKSIVAMSRDISLAEQEISSRIAWRERNEAAVKAWLVKSE